MKFMLNVNKKNFKLLHLI